MAPGDVETGTATYAVQSSDLGGSIDNAVVAGSDQAADATANVSIAVPTPSQTIEKTYANDDADGSGDVSVGDTITYSYMVTNTGTANLTGVGVLDTPLGAITLGDIAGNGVSFMAPGDVETGTATYTVQSSDLGGSIDNAAVAGSDQAADATDSVSIAVPTPVDQTAPSVTVTAPNGGQDWLAGSVQDITWNANDNVGVTSVDLLYSSNGASGSFITIASGEANDGTYSWTVPNAPTSNAFVKVVAHDTVGNSAEDISDGAFTISAQVDLAVTIVESMDPVIAGSGSGNLIYEVTVTNNGSSDASGVMLNEVLTLPPGVTITSVVASGTTTFVDPTWLIGDLAVNASETLTITLTVGASTAAGTNVIGNTATVTAVNETLINTGDDAATESTTVQRRVDLQVSKLDTPDPVTAGSGASNLTHTVTVTNAGPSNASGVTLSEVISLPAAGVSIVSITPSGVTSYAPADSSSGTWTVGNLAAGASETLTIVMTVGASAAGGAIVSDTATVTAVNETDVNAGNDSATENTTVQRAVDIQVSKTDTPDPVTAGSGAGNLTHIVTVTNVGPSDASGVTLSEVISLPAGVSIVSITPSGATSYAPADTSPGTWTVGDLAVGASETLTIVMTVDASTADGAIISDTATVTGVNETMINTGDDTATENTTVQRRVDLQVSKLDTPDPVTAGSGPDNLTHTVTVTNAGPSDASGVTLSETVSLPAGASIVSITPSGMTHYALANSSPGTWIVGDLAAGASETLTIVMTVDASTADGPTISNTATLTSVNEPDTNAGNDSVTEHTTVQRTSQEPQLASHLVSMQASGLRYNRRTGVMSSYITITNTSSEIISGDVHFVINSLSDPNVSLVGGDGTAATGTYFDLTPYLNDGRLDPGASVTIRLDFYNPLRRRFTFEWDLWGRIG